jgi:hypothetical protein
LPWVAAVLAFLLLTPSHASADWLITPFLGTVFSGETTLLLLDPAAIREKKLTFGISGALLTDGFLGLEASVDHTPGFFSSSNASRLNQTSRVTTVTGNVIVAAPIALTRESLRPYLIGGLGLMQARATDAVLILPIDTDYLVVTLGGGAIGMLTPRTGVRFEVRHFKAASGADGPLAREGLSRLSFWRASVGLTLRY